MNLPLRTLLSEVARRAEEAGDETFARYVEDQTKKEDAEIESFLRSNEMWGGSGSVADSAGATADRTKRKRIEEAMIALGELQIQMGVVNPRTDGWVDAFRQWRASGL